MNRFSMLGGLAIVVAASGCGGVAPGEEGEVLGEQQSAIQISSSAWKAGTSSNPYMSMCSPGQVMVGTAFDGNIPMIKCAVLTSTSADYFHRYDAIGTKLGVKPACFGSTDAAIGWGIAFPSFVTTLPCANVSFTLGASYVDGAGNPNWGQEWFTHNGHSVLGHVCKKLGYIVTAYNYDQDLFVCAS